ncbi:MAG: FHA domain-containing protein [Phycisphaeraceae bacterium]
MATLLVISGRNEGEWYSIPEDRPLVVGREETLIAELLDPAVSRRHFEIRRNESNDRYYVADLKSRNGVRVEGKRINGLHPLVDDNLIQVGYTLMSFTIADVEDDGDAQQRIREAQERRAKFIATVRAHEAEIEEKARRRDERNRRARGGKSSGGFLGGLFRRSS